MTGKTHQILGLGFGLTSYLTLAEAHYNPATFAWVVVISSIAALLPDIDSPSAQIWHSLPFGRTMSRVTGTFLDHRNFSHSLLGLATFGTLFYKLISLAPAYWNLNVHAIVVAFVAAYSSHLLADMVTVEGVPLLFPYQRMFGIPPHPFQGVRMVTGKWFENLIVFPVANLALVLLIANHWAIIKAILLK